MFYPVTIGINTLKAGQFPFLTETVIRTDPLNALLVVEISDAPLEILPDTNFKI